MSRHLVTGMHPVCDTPAGVYVELDDPRQIAQLIEAGAIAPADDDLAALTKGDLQALAAERGIDAPAKTTKDELIELLTQGATDG